MSTDSMSPETLSKVAGFFTDVSTANPITPESQTKHLFPDLILRLLKPDSVHKGRVSCLVTVHPASTNAFGGMHGGAVASVAETVSTACARTVVGEDKELFLGELSMSYLSAAPRNAEIRVDASVTRSGRNLTVVAAEFRLKDSGNLTYTSRATFYNMPVSSL